MYAPQVDQNAPDIKEIKSSQFLKQSEARSMHFKGKHVGFSDN